MLQALQFIVDFFTNGIVIQVIGFIGMAISIVSFQCKDYQKVIWMRVIGELVFALQYFLLGGYVAMATNLTSCVTNTVYRERVKRGKSTRVFQVIFGILFAVIGALTWQGPITLLVIFAKMLSTVANGINSTKVIRILNLVIMPLWLIYDILVFSIGGALTDIVTITSIIIAMVRLDKQKTSEL